MRLTLFVFSWCFLCAVAKLWYKDDAMRGCYCVPRNMCKDNDFAIGEKLVDIRSAGGVCDNSNKVCCQHIVPPAAGAGTCGTYSSMVSNSRVTTDSHEAQFGEVPWTVVVLERNFNPRFVQKYIYRCGGSLIHPQVVMTAAHCMNSIQSNLWAIRGGDYSRTSDEEALPHQDRSVVKIITHPLYVASSLKNDLALLILDAPFELADNVRLICLPPPEIQPGAVKCLASGWGKEKFEDGLYSTIMKVIELPLVDREACESSLRSTRLGQFFQLHDSFLCAGGEHNKDTCKGDGGSPLVCPISGEPGRFVQLGIVSWGIGCGGDNTPGVYVNVAHVRNWIDEQLTLLDFDISTYQYGT